jgi:transcriptional regulator NrdR family protein
MESPCYQRGKMACVSCHEMHQHRGDTRTPTEWAAGQLKPGMDGNRACVQCHSRFADAAETARHTHHQEGSSGSKCYNCHMPHSSFGLLKAARSHMISSPTVLESSQIGRPNACNLCHQDQTLAWTAEKLSLWYKQPIPKLSEDEQKVAASAIWVLRGNAVQRALTAWSYGWPDAQTASGNHWQAPLLGQLLDDPVDPVRIIAHRSLKRLPGFGEFDYDFLWPPAKRSTAVLDVRNIWQQNQHGQEHSFSRQSLIDPTGRIQDADFQRLLKLRDNTTVEIAE